MAADKRYTPEYLQALLHSSPGSAEELTQAKKQIDLYFAHLNAKQAVPGQNPNQSNSQVHGHAQTGLNTTSQSSTAPRADFSKNMLIVISILFAFLMTIPLLFRLDLLSTMNAQDWLICCIPLPIIALQVALKMQSKTSRAGKRGKQVKPAGHGHPAGKKLLLAASDHKSRLRHRGEHGDSTCQEKWSELQKLIEQILREDSLKMSLGPAEECLSLIGYLAAQEKKPRSTRIDPLNMLIERLIEEHELEWADKLSHHYLSLLTGDAV